MKAIKALLKYNTFYLALVCSLALIFNFFVNLLLKVEYQPTGWDAVGSFTGKYYEHLFVFLFLIIIFFSLLITEFLCSSILRIIRSYLFRIHRSISIQPSSLYSLRCNSLISIYFLLYSGLLLTYICSLFNIGITGIDPVELPFKLVGILNIYMPYVLPLLLFILTRKKASFNSLVFILWILLGFYRAYSTGSKLSCLYPLLACLTLSFHHFTTSNKSNRYKIRISSVVVRLLFPITILSTLFISFISRARIFSILIFENVDSFPEIDFQTVVKLIPVLTSRLESITSLYLASSSCYGFSNDFDSSILLSTTAHGFSSQLISTLFFGSVLRTGFAVDFGRISALTCTLNASWASGDFIPFVSTVLVTVLALMLLNTTLSNLIAMIGIKRFRWYYRLMPIFFLYLTHGRISLLTYSMMAMFSFALRSFPKPKQLFSSMTAVL